jgi:hypothetical protein
VTLPTLLAVDPGLKPGCVELEWGTGRVLRVTHKLAVAIAWRPHWDIAVTEGQWYFGAPPGNGKRTGRARTGAPDVNDLLSLAFRAGFTLASIPATRRLRLKPQVWRGNSNAAKAQVQARIARELTTDEKKLFADVLESRHGDVLDAIGIGRAAVVLAPTTTEYDWEI